MQGGIKRNSPLVKESISHGFTIVETMIVLVVTGALFFSVMAVMSGRQQQAQFRQSINAVKTEFEQIIANVQSGHYPSIENFNCTVGADGNPVIALSATAVKQGQNQNCVFFGSVIQLKIEDQDRYAVYPVAGLRSAESFEESRSKVVSPATDTKMLQFGLEPVWSRATGVGTAGAVAFVTQLEGIGKDNRGNQNIEVRPVNENIGKSIASTTDVLNANMSASAPKNGIKICYKSGTTKQHGIISISGGGAVAITIDNGDCPA